MKSEWQFSFAFSAIDGSHLPIKCPKGGSEAMKQYYNFKKCYSKILLALVDARYRFTWIRVETPGNTRDSTYFQSTDLYDRTEAGLVIPDQVQVVNGLEIPPLILGDRAFPLRTWITKPYRDAVLSEENFNYRGSWARMVTEKAFGRLKSRFRVLHKKCESGKKTVKAMVLACVTLHNICIDTGDVIPRDFHLSYDSTNNKRRDREIIRGLLDLTDARQKNFELGRSEVLNVRKAIADYFWDEKQYHEK